MIYISEHGSEDMETLPNGQTFISSVCMSAKEMGVRTAYELRHKKTCLRGFRPGRHKPSCTTTEDGQILDLGSRGIVLSI